MSKAVRLTISVSWWVRWYLSALATVACFTGMEPDEEKAVAVVMRGIKVRAK